MNTWNIPLRREGCYNRTLTLPDWKLCRVAPASLRMKHTLLSEDLALQDLARPPSRFAFLPLPLTNAESSASRDTFSSLSDLPMPQPHPGTRVPPVNSPSGSQPTQPLLRKSSRAPWPPGAPSAARGQAPCALLTTVSRPWDLLGVCVQGRGNNQPLLHGPPHPRPAVWPGEPKLQATEASFLLVQASGFPSSLLPPGPSPDQPAGT